MRRRRVLETLTAALLAILMIGHGVAFAQGNSNKPPKDDGGGTEEPALPPVAYVIDIPEMPADSTGVVWVYDINIHGQVVGYYSAVDGQRAFIYDADNGMRDLNAIVGLPHHPESYWRLRWAVGINDHGVVVGGMELTGSSPLQVRPIAIDLDAEAPVVDLLPDVWEDVSYGRRINENGDILGVYLPGYEDGKPADGSGGWLFNPGLYGDPEFREERDSLPLDMSDAEPAFLPESLFGADSLLLNNPVGDLPAQVAGMTSDNFAFRYTTGLNPQLEVFSNIHGIKSVAGLNDSGTFCGYLSETEGKRKDWFNGPFRYNTQLDKLPSLSHWPGGLNSSGDIVFHAGFIYREDWLQYGQTYVPIDDLLIGTDENLEAWFTTSGKGFTVMSDRAGESDAGVIAGRLGGVGLYVLWPVSTEE